MFIITSIIFLSKFYQCFNCWWQTEHFGNFIFRDNFWNFCSNRNFSKSRKCTCRFVIRNQFIKKIYVLKLPIGSETKKAIGSSTMPLTKSESNVEIWARITRVLSCSFKHFMKIIEKMPIKSVRAICSIAATVVYVVAL